ncbi:hypothetical protein HPP92_009715 [Vanilla planifolia]|uniref:Aminoacyl-tRNA synthetase class II (D/K/N) domain-containing protein n=1 Tax=Vanilla planifolia TaxID=51239 RepID=A0A835RGB6_VANPL|nr:hypothetical protein HPP92_009715 [Vanilla planifolia]
MPANINECQQQQPAAEERLERFKYSNRVLLSSILGRADGGLGLVGKRVRVAGWVKSSVEKAMPDVLMPKPAALAEPPVVKDVSCSEILASRLPMFRRIVRILMNSAGNAEFVGKMDGAAKPVPSIAYLRINDGSSTDNLQITVNSSVYPLSKILPTGTSIMVEGVIEKLKAQRKHALELKVEKVLYVGIVDTKKYPLLKEMLSMAFLRAFPHFRPRTTTIASIARIRSSLSYSTHQFFQSKGFLHVHMPINTKNSRIHRNMLEVATFSNVSNQEAKELETVKAAIMEKSKRIEELKRSHSNKEALITALKDLKKTNELAVQLEHQQSSTLTSIKAPDIFPNSLCCHTYQSASSGLHLESYACSLGNVYSFGPTFQTVDVSPSKELAELWKVEVEMAFAEQEDAINCAEDYLRYLCQSVLENCLNDIKFLCKRIDNTCIDRIKSMASGPFVRVSYPEALENFKKFEEKAELGTNLSTEHGSILAEKLYQQPFIVYNYPEDSKPIYFRSIDDTKTVSAFDIITPKIGKLIQGGQKEERLDKLTTRMKKLGLPLEEFDWYLDLRRHGTVKHSGFSFGLEEMVMFVSGVDDLRDTVTFPRDWTSTDN